MSRMDGLERLLREREGLAPGPKAKRERVKRFRRFRSPKGRFAGFGKEHIVAMYYLTEHDPRLRETHHKLDRLSCPKVGPISEV